MKKRATLTASLIAVPLMSATGVAAPVSHSDPAGAVVQPRQETQLKFTSVFLKITEPLAIVGLDNSRTIYKNSKGEFFYLDQFTGDMKFLTADAWSKYTSTLIITGRPLIAVKVDAVKYSGPVTPLGVDAKGNVVQRNSKGVVFHVNPINGDMVIVK